MQVEAADKGDTHSWLEIVPEIEPLFGPMPTFETTLVRKIGQAAAFCVREIGPAGDAVILGGMLLGGRHPEGWIRWLAVRASARGRGVGRGLVQTALERFSQSETVLLDTFREDIEAGRPARRLYESFGFKPGELLTIDGQPRQRYSLHKSPR
jgi:ribosomal protein S18 acetylase RimI-like enzyme